MGLQCIFLLYSLSLLSQNIRVFCLNLIVYASTRREVSIEREIAIIKIGFAFKYFTLIRSHSNAIEANGI